MSHESGSTSETLVGGIDHPGQSGSGKDKGKFLEEEQIPTSRPPLPTSLPPQLPPRRRLKPKAAVPQPNQTVFNPGRGPNQGQDRVPVDGLTLTKSAVRNKNTTSTELNNSGEETGWMNGPIRKWEAGKEHRSGGCVSSTPYDGNNLSDKVGRDGSERGLSAPARTLQQVSPTDTRREGENGNGPSNTQSKEGGIITGIDNDEMRKKRSFCSSQSSPLLHSRLTTDSRDTTSPLLPSSLPHRPPTHRLPPTAPSPHIHPPTPTTATLSGFIDHKILSNQSVINSHPSCNLPELNSSVGFGGGTFPKRPRSLREPLSEEIFDFGHTPKPTTGHFKRSYSTSSAIPSARIMPTCSSTSLVSDSTGYGSLNRSKTSGSFVPDYYSTEDYYSASSHSSSPPSILSSKSSVSGDTSPLHHPAAPQQPHHPPPPTLFHFPPAPGSDGLTPVFKSHPTVSNGFTTLPGHGKPTAVQYPLVSGGSLRNLSSLSKLSQTDLAEASIDAYYRHSGGEFYDLDSINLSFQDQNDDEITNDIQDIIHNELSYLDEVSPTPAFAKKDMENMADQVLAMIAELKRSIITEAVISSSDSENSANDSKTCTSKVCKPSVPSPQIISQKSLPTILEAEHIYEEIPYDTPELVVKPPSPPPLPKRNPLTLTDRMSYQRMSLPVRDSGCQNNFKHQFSTSQRRAGKLGGSETSNGFSVDRTKSAGSLEWMGRSKCANNNSNNNTITPGQPVVNKTVVWKSDPECLPCPKNPGKFGPRRNLVPIQLQIRRSFQQKNQLDMDTLGFLKKLHHRSEPDLLPFSTATEV